MTTAWFRQPSGQDRRPWSRRKETSADPQQLLDALQQADAIVTKTGAHTYHFESTKAYDTQYATGQRTFTGDVTLDGGNRIAKVTYESTDKGQMKPGVKEGALPAAITVAGSYQGVVE